MLLDKDFKIETNDYTDVKLDILEHSLKNGSFIMYLSVFRDDEWIAVYSAHDDEKVEFARLSKLYKKICIHLFKDSEVVHNGQK